MLAFELGSTKWTLGFTTAPAQRPRVRTMSAGDLPGLVKEIQLAKIRFGLPLDAPVQSCYGAGRDGFWLHRWLFDVAELARRYGISRKTAYKWIDRYDVGGPAGLVDRSRRPAQCPHGTPPPIIAALLDVRRHHPTWGAKKLLKIVATRHREVKKRGGRRTYRRRLEDAGRGWQPDRKPQQNMPCGCKPDARCMSSTAPQRSIIKPDPRSRPSGDIPQAGW